MHKGRQEHKYFFQEARRLLRQDWSHNFQERVGILMIGSSKRPFYLFQ